MTECYLYKADQPDGVRSYWKSYVFPTRQEAVAWARAWSRYHGCRLLAELYIIAADGYMSENPYELVFVGRWRKAAAERTR